LTLISPRLGLFSVLLMMPCLGGAETVIHHQLHVKLTPASGRLQVRDTITLPPRDGPVYFDLNAGFTLVPDDGAVRIDAADGKQATPGTKRYRVVLPHGSSRFTLSYQGNPDAAGGVPPAQAGHGDSLSSNGIFLDAAGHWYPQFDDELVTFSMAIELPPAWKAISQGRRRPQAGRSSGAVKWEENEPQQEIYLLAAAYHEYDRSAGDINTSVFLRSADPSLADRYLTAIAEYLDMYSRLLGPYPYAKFAVVENTWESGYGMPSFTLLGPTVMRFPFILHTSLPHEILHNWWGNSVYVDYAQGNWSEGLTAYLADHLLREQSGKGVAYRRNALMRYTNYVSAGNDFPLKDFQGRHDEATQAVGYDKALMVFHMLRVRLGDKDFLTALRTFYREQRFQVAGWDDLRRVFEAVSGDSLKSEFDQWLNRSGAPSLQLHAARARPRDGRYQLSVELAQSQAGPAYRLHVPVAVQLEGRRRAWQTAVDLSQKRQTIHLSVPLRPWRIAVDPQFDVFRRLDPGELPPTLSEALGAQSLLIVLPSEAAKSLRDAYAALARAWTASGTKVEVRWDRQLSRLPSDRAVWLMGWKNRFFPQLEADLRPQMSLSAAESPAGERLFHREPREAVVLTARQGGSSGGVLLWLGCDNPAAMPGLARKLPHYGSYSYLAFHGDAPTNTLKGQWRVVDSPLIRKVTQADHAAPPASVEFHLKPRSALTAADTAGAGSGGR
jgi:aminopeptidase N